jgi:hypothetical protein
MDWAALCDRDRLGLLEQPASAITSVAFVVAAAGILAGRPRGSVTPTREQQTVFALLTAGIGVGSFVQHGPHPSWQAYVHDLPLAAVLVFVATDAVHRPALRAPVLLALGTAAAGAVLGRLTGRGSRCGPESLMLGHPLWHLLAAAALWRLAAAVGARRTSMVRLR